MQLYPHNPAHDLFRGEALLRAVNGECDGGDLCTEEHGMHGMPVEVYRVRRVSGVGGLDWGLFAYCEHARQRDADAGFEVISLNEWDALKTEPAQAVAREVGKP